MLLANVVAGLILGIEIVLYVFLGVNVEFRPYPPFFFFRPQISGDNLTDIQPASIGYFDPATTTTVTAATPAAITTTTTTTTATPNRSCDTVNVPCGDSLVIVAGSGTILSPNYPNEYCPNLGSLGCQITLTAPRGKTIQLTFDEFIVESCCDRFILYDGTSSSSVLAVYSGYDNPAPITSTTEIMTIDFFSDGSNEIELPSLGPGRWKVTYTVV